MFVKEVLREMRMRRAAKGMLRRRGKEGGREGREGREGEKEKEEEEGEKKKGKKKLEEERRGINMEGGMFGVRTEEENEAEDGNLRMDEGKREEEREEGKVGKEYGMEEDGEESKENNTKRGESPLFGPIDENVFENESENENENENENGMNFGQNEEKTGKAGEGRGDEMKGRMDKEEEEGEGEKEEEEREEEREEDEEEAKRSEEERMRRREQKMENEGMKSDELPTEKAVIECCLQILANINENPNNNKFFIDPVLLGLVVELMSDSVSVLRVMAFRFFVNFSCGSDEDIQRLLLQPSFFDVFALHLSSSSSCLRREAALLACNIGAGTSSQACTLLRPRCVFALCHIARADIHSAQCHALRALRNVGLLGKEAAGVVVEAGCVEAVAQILKRGRHRSVVCEAMDLLWVLLGQWEKKDNEEEEEKGKEEGEGEGEEGRKEEGEKKEREEREESKLFVESRKRKNKVAEQLADKGGVESFVELSMEKYESVKKRSVCLLKKYFPEAILEEEMAEEEMEEEEEGEEGEKEDGYDNYATKSSFNGNWQVAEKPMGMLRASGKQPDPSFFELIETSSSSIFSQNVPIYQTLDAFRSTLSESSHETSENTSHSLSSPSSSSSSVGSLPYHYSSPSNINTRYSSFTSFSPSSPSPSSSSSSSSSYQHSPSLISPNSCFTSSKSSSLSQTTSISSTFYPVASSSSNTFFSSSSSSSSSFSFSSHLSSIAGFQQPICQQLFHSHTAASIFPSNSSCF
ncbi:uncharacterized protein MONOS_10448 [Monocercomonoides exilis]|uniref:uncharacterized protein n=1 Tax=Monocercomonoides exilis TaxID=2049356 RepID=UPI00355AA335|nr:hypothetical protein MONOS_10448 [Monocercomonoides exilis]|eukprot:MONOS_10448.1-p1 / transcript=MONOS_10448.1 / gene=MONOS_10448 / organism=Monocercomonoides_exilis_PA203 / gene_product=unspecified product / transcript_product=unspecified product / location=Mono_scaffold00476:9589-12004(+) / protein_length=752 / sequence_SO=supercontig / SO=protein_coding / is_pseudo=false